MVHFSLQFFGDFTQTSGHPSNCKKINYWAQWLESYIQGRQVLKQFCNALANKTIKIVFTLNEAFAKLKLQGASVRGMSSDIVCT